MVWYISFSHTLELLGYSNYSGKNLIPNNNIPIQKNKSYRPNN